MSVRFSRNYAEIHRDLTDAIGTIDGFYRFFDMNADDWHKLTEKDRYGCLRIAADDIFYGLGASRTLHVGRTVILYDRGRSVIKIAAGRKVTHVIHLI